MRAGTRPHAATARASERAHVLGSIWLLLAHKTSEMKSFAGTRLSFEQAPGSNAGACHALAGVCVGPSMARWLLCTAKGQFNGVVDSGDDRRAVGTLTSPIASPTCIELPRRGPGPFAVYHRRTRHLPAGSYPPQFTGTADACSPG